MSRFAQQLLMDLATLVLFTVVWGIPGSAIAWGLFTALPLVPWWLWGLAVPFGYFGFLTGLLLTAWVVRLLLPAVKPGRYPFPNHPMARAWAISLAMRRAVFQLAWERSYFSMGWLRWLMFRAMGARAPYAMYSASDVEVVDFQLVTIHRDAMLAARTVISCHFVEGDLLRLVETVIGEGSQVMVDTALGPGTVIGKNVVIGPSTVVAMNCEFGDGAKVGFGCRFSVGVKVGANAVIGTEVLIEPGVVIGEGAVIPNYVRVPSRTKIPAGAKWKPDAAQATVTEESSASST